MKPIIIIAIAIGLVGISVGVISIQSINNTELQQKETEILNLQNKTIVNYYKSLQEQQKVEELNNLEKQKAEIRILAKDSPLIKGIINGNKLSFWVQPLPQYVSKNVQESVESFSSFLNGTRLNGIDLTQTSSQSNADFTINWVKDYSTHVGRQIGEHLLVGLGASYYNTDWKPFDGISIYRTMYHELGHAMGQGHSDDNNNIMFPSGANKYEYDYEKIITLSDGNWQQIDFYNDGEIFFHTETVDFSLASYKVFVLGNDNTPQNVINLKGNFYSDCGAYKSNYLVFGGGCNVQKGSSLVLYNPSTFDAGVDARVKVTITDLNDHEEIDYNFESSTRYFTEEKLSYIRDLFNE